MATKKKEAQRIDLFTKEQFLESKKYVENRDVISVILDEDTMYSFSEVDMMLEKFLSKEV